MSRANAGEGRPLVTLLLRLFLLDVLLCPAWFALAVGLSIAEGR